MWLALRRFRRDIRWNASVDEHVDHSDEEAASEAQTRPCGVDGLFELIGLMRESFREVVPS
jgi:hypothetical protein